MFHCKRCDTKHGRQNSSAFRQKSDMKGHYSSQCWSKKKNSKLARKKINTIENSELIAEEEEEEILYVHSIKKNKYDN